MKIRNVFTLLFAVTALFACNDDDDSNNPNDKGNKSISVSLAPMSGLQTRATQAGNFLTKDTMNVKSILINLTDAEDAVITSHTIQKDLTADSDWDKLTDSSKGLKFINVPQSVSKVYVYGNPGNAVNGNKVTTTLDQQQGSEVLYTGMDDDLKPIENEPINPDPTVGTTYTANVMIKPVVARLQINKIYITDKNTITISREINGQKVEATVKWTSFSADLKGIYLNKFFNTYHDSTNVENLFSNSSYVNTITEGKWLFNSPTTVDAAAYASYNKYTGGNYETMPMTLPTNQSYAFNIFPGSQIPSIHLDLANVKIENLSSSNTSVFNPALAGSGRFANIVKYTNEANNEMTAADFKPGTIYNMEVELIPTLDTDFENIQYNVLVHVTIAPWAEEKLTPGFDLDK